MSQIVAALSDAEPGKERVYRGDRFRLAELGRVADPGTVASTIPGATFCILSRGRGGQQVALLAAHDEQRLLGEGGEQRPQVDPAESGR